MQNVDVQKAVTSGTLPCPYSAQVLQGYLDLEDLALVARLVLLDPEPHNRARYELVGQNASSEDIAKQIKSLTGKSITCQNIPREKVVEGTPAPGGQAEAEFYAEALDRMLYYYDKRYGSSSVIEEGRRSSDK